MSGASTCRRKSHEALHAQLVLGSRLSATFTARTHSRTAPWVTSSSSDGASASLHSTRHLGLRMAK